MARVRKPDEMAAGIFEILHMEHADVSALFEQIEAALEEGDDATDLFTVLADSLLAHAKAEETVVYPRFAQIDAIADRMREAQEEHAQMERQLEDLRGSAPNAETWLSKMKLLQDDVLHHVAEEEGDIFEAAKDDLDAEESRQLADTFRRERERRTGGPKAALRRGGRVRTRMRAPFPGRN